tara:strand:+ start:152 stop:571 length:420 start_codon:yes stop_codon:yes gene_type:complete
MNITNMNKKQAFAYFGISQKNEVWSWSGISDNQETVALTIWIDQCDWIKKDRKYVTSIFNKNNELWRDLPGNKERIEIIKYCINNLGSRFRAIFITPVKKGVFDETREIKSVRPYDKCFFKILEFNEITGEYTAESIRE